MEEQRPGLPGLPNELWLVILDNFRPAPLGYGCIAPSRTFMTNRATLRELCLTSSSMLAMARPLLYESIVFWSEKEGGNPAAMTWLVRTLLQRRELRPLVKNLAMTLTNDVHYRSDWNPFPGPHGRYTAVARAWMRNVNKVTSQLGPDGQRILNLAQLTVAHVEALPVMAYRPYVVEAEAIVSNRLVALLLVLTDELKQLLELDMISAHVTQGGRLRTIQALLADEAMPASFLGHLEILHTQLHPDYQTSSCEWDLLAGLGRLRHVEISSYPGLTRARDTVRTDVPMAPLRHVRKLEFRNLNTSFALLRTLLSTPHLLSLSTDVPADWALQIWPYDPVTFDEALLVRADCLQALEVITSHKAEAHLSHAFGGHGRLTCLPRLTSLTRLCVEPHVLLDWTDANAWPGFWSALPPNLQVLWLRFVPDKHADERQPRFMARSGVGVALRAPPERWKSKLPHLRLVHLSPLMYGKKATDMIREDLQAAGIKLTWSLGHEDGPGPDVGW